MAVAGVRGVRRHWLVWLAFVCLTFLVGPRLQAQLRIDNPGHLDFPEQRAQLILNKAAEVVAEEFHVHDMREIEFPLTLVLGSKEDYYEETEDTKIYSIHLRAWDEDKFAVSVVRLSVHRLITRERRNKMLERIMNRVNSMSPVDVSQFARKSEKERGDR
jgi:hypothetical protein